MSVIKRKPKITAAVDHWMESQASSFHEYTKYSEIELIKKSQRIMEYMTAPRHILETARNVKEYLVEKAIALKPPQSLELNFCDLLSSRRSSHHYSGEAMPFQALSNLLGWAAGVTKTMTLTQPEVAGETLTFRAYPSGGGLYPCETYLVALNVEGLRAGVYHYNNAKHALDPIDLNLDLKEVERTFMAEKYIADIGCIVVVTSMFERQVTKYGDRAYRLSLIEAGHLMQNVLLSATAQDMGSLAWGGYHDNEVSALLRTDVINEPPVHVALVGQKGEP